MCQTAYTESHCSGVLELHGVNTQMVSVLSLQTAVAIQKAISLKVYHVGQS